MVCSLTLFPDQPSVHSTGLPRQVFQLKGLNYPPNFCFPAVGVARGEDVYSNYRSCHLDTFAVTVRSDISISECLPKRGNFPQDSDNLLHLTAMTLALLLLPCVSSTTCPGSEEDCDVTLAYTGCVLHSAHRQVSLYISPVQGCV